MPASWVTKVAELWYAAQVELQGRYSPQRVRALADYTESTSLLRAMFVVGVTPIPCLIITILVDLVYLRPPSEGLQANKLFVGREYVSFWIFGFLATHQFRHALPSLPLSNRRIVVNNVIVAALAVSVIYALGLVVGFPLPFGIIAGTPAWVSFISISLVAAWAKHIRANPGVWPHVMNSLKVWMCQVALVVVYPTYFYVFTTLSTTGKTYFAFLLPVIKLILRNVFSRTVVHLQDDMPEVIILNVEVFNALFVAYGMQNSPSMWTTVGLMVVDLLQLSASLYDMSLILQDLKSVTEKLVKKNSLRDDPTGLEVKWSATIMMEQMQEMLERQRKSPQAASSSSSSESELPDHVADDLVMPFAPNSLSAQAPHFLVEKAVEQPVTSLRLLLATQQQSGRVVPVYEQASQSSNLLPSLELQYVQEVRQLLYITEFVTLINFVEVMIPFVFSIYLVTMYHLPNRAYYAQFDDMDAAKLQQTLANMLFYGALQIVSLLLLGLVLWYKMRFSAIRQLAFVLEKQWDQVQVKLIFWMFYNVQASLRHFGFDYTFQFAWLHQEKASAEGGER